MPAVGAWLATAAFPALFGTAVTWGTILKTAFVIGAAARANSQRKKARRAMLDSIQDRTIMVRSAVADVPIVYGRARVSGPFRPVGTAGSLAERFSFTVSLAGAIDAIEEVWFGDESLGTLDSNGWATGGRYAKSRQVMTGASGGVPPGGSVTLPYTPDVVDSVSLYIGTPYGSDDPTLFYQWQTTTEYTLSGATVTFTNPAHVGLQYQISYRHTVADSLARAKGYLGQAGQAADPYLLSEFPSTWTTSHRSDGASYLACTLLYDQDVFTSGIPNVSAIVRGRRVYDPRLDSTNGGSGSHRYTDPTTWAWSRNPALIARDYLKMELGCDDSEIDDTTVIAAANACDEWVQVSPSMTEGDFFESGGIKYQLRYTFDGALSSQADRLSNLESILMAMVGSAVYSAGKWELQAGVWEAPTTLALDDDDLAGGQVVVQARQARRDLINGVRGNYMHPDKWVVDDFPPYTSNTFVTEDGGAVSIRQIDLPMIRCPYRAQRVAKLMMFQSRQALTMTATWNLGAYEITPTKMVDLTIERYGWTGKDFKCMNRVYDPMGGVELSFKEEAAAIYEWDYNDAIDPDPAPNTTLPDPRDVPAITGLAVSSGSTVYERLSDGTIRPLAVVTWDAVTNIGVTNGGYIEFIWKRANETNWAVSRLPGTETRFQIPTAAGEFLNIGVRAVSGAQVTGEWSFVGHDVSADALSNASDTVRGVGVNLFPNAGLKFATWPFGLYAGSGGEASAWSFVHGAPSASNAPAPYGCVQAYTTNTAAPTFTGFDTTDPATSLADTAGFVPVIAGGRYELQVRAKTIGGRSRLVAKWFNTTGLVIGHDVVSGGVDTSTNLTSVTSQEIDSFDLLWGFATAPTGAVWVHPYVIHERPSTGVETYLLTAMPYVGVAHEAQTLPSPWVEGANAVSTDLIGDGAATTVDSATYAGGTFSRDWGSFGSETFADTEVSVTNSESVSRDVLLTMTVFVSDDLTSPQNGAIGMSYWTGSAWQWLGAPWYINLRPEYGGNGSYTVSGVVSVSAGGTGKYRLMQVRQGGSTESVTWGPVNTRAELIKR